MPDDFDFERHWQAKLADCLEAHGGEALREAVMEGGDQLGDRSDRRDVVDWSREAVARLDAMTDPATARSIMAGCACQYPVAQLQAARQAYESTGDVDAALAVLQAQFEAFLRDDLALSDDQVAEIIRRGWGLAGVRQGDTVVATKIPKSGYLEAYLDEADPEKRRAMYCHCPRVRDAIAMSAALPATYCYCGAGFYKGIWEQILQRPVHVEVLESVLTGGDVCTIAVHVGEGVAGVTLRTATDGDLEFLFSLLKASMRSYIENTYGEWDEDWQRHHFVSSTRPETQQIVELDGQPIGCLYVQRTPEAMKLSRIYILPEAQNQGIGTMLIQKVIEDARAEGLPVALRVMKVNPARRLYERLGFAVTGETETHYLMRAD